MGILQALPRGFIETDHVLVDRARGGDELAFARLVDRHSRDALATALGLLGDRTEAEEAAQEAFCRAWQKLATLQDPAKFKLWVAGILYRLCRDVIRAKGRARKALGALAPAAPQPDEQAALVVDEAMELPDEYRDPIVLFYLHDMSIAELAEMLGITEENAKVRLHRARKMLRDRLEKKGMR
jgi:RNA polymerase sigma-70 factor (ECF subfamily)